MTQFRIEDLVALPMQPSIRVRVGPEEIVEVDMISWDSMKDDFITWALSLPGIDQGVGWRLLKPYTGNNGMLAKLAIALGELAGIWRMYPSPDQPNLWGRTHPSILQLKKPLAATRRVPKPSAGDLDSDKDCGCCRRSMGPADSKFHDLTESDDTEGICLECDVVCGPNSKKCKIGVKKTASRRPPDTVEEDLSDHNVVDIVGLEFEEYANRFSGGK